MAVVACPMCALAGATILGQPAAKDMTEYQCPRCGPYSIDALTPALIAHDWNDKRYLLTSVTRAASDSGHYLEITNNNLRQLIESANRSDSLYDLVDRVMLFLAERVLSFRAPARLNKDVDYPLISAKGEREMNELLVTAGDLGWFEPATSKITINGWRRIEELKRTQPRSRSAFVAMWFDDQMDEPWNNGFKPGIEHHDYYRARRMKEVQHNERIDDGIIAEIRASGLLVADFSGDRGGVYFEAGFARGLGIPVIWTCRKDWLDRLHFDTRQYNHIVWEKSDDLKQQLVDRIAATVLPRPAATEGT